MEKIAIKDKNNKRLAVGFSFLDYKDEKYTSKTDFIELLIKDIPEIKGIGYAGFISKEELKKHLVQAVFGGEKFSEIQRSNFQEKEIVNIVNGTLEKCHENIKSQMTYVFIFPNFNKFKKDKMNGVGGFCSWKNTILVDVNLVRGWQGALARTLAHEFHHSVIANKKNPQIWTLLEALVYEGMADNFAESLTGKPSPWAKALSKKESFVVLQKITKFLDKNDERSYQQVFFGKNSKYPMWAGYVIGYQMIKAYLKKQPNLNWNEVSKTKPVDIIGGE